MTTAKRFKRSFNAICRFSSVSGDTYVQNVRFVRVFALETTRPHLFSRHRLILQTYSNQLLTNRKRNNFTSTGSIGFSLNIDRSVEFGINAKSTMTLVDARRTKYNRRSNHQEQRDTIVSFPTFCPSLAGHDHVPKLRKSPMFDPIQSTFPALERRIVPSSNDKKDFTFRMGSFIQLNRSSGLQTRSKQHRVMTMKKVGFRMKSMDALQFSPSTVCQSSSPFCLIIRRKTFIMDHLLIFFLNQTELISIDCVVFCDERKISSNFFLMLS